MHSSLAASLSLLGAAFAPGDADAAKALGFPRPGRLSGTSDSRAPAGSAVAP